MRASHGPDSLPGSEPTASLGIDKIDEVRLAAQGPGLFLAGMVATLLLEFFLRGEAPAIAVVVSCTFLTFFLVVRWYGHRPWWPAVAGGMAGLCAFWLYAEPPQELPKEAFGERILVHGIVADRIDRSDSILLEVSGVEGPETGWVSSGKIRVTVDHGNEVAVIPGDRIELRIKLRHPTGYRVPGAFDYGAWLRNNDFVATGGVRGDGIRVLEHTGRQRWNRWRHQVSQWIALRLPPETRGLAEGLMVGKRGWIDPVLNDALQVSGTYHLLAISGQQLAMVAGWSFLLFRWILVLWLPGSRRWDMKRVAAILALVPMLVYSEFSGWSEATQRAALATGLVMLGMLLLRKTSGTNTLIVSAFVLLFFWPREIFGAGFHLTFMAVAALIFYYSVFPITGSLWRRLGLSLAMTLFIDLSMAPIVAYHFHRIMPYSFFGNLFAVPWVSVFSIPFGLGALIFHWLPGGWGDLFLDVMSWSLKIYVVFVKAIAELPFAWLRVPGPSLWGILWSITLLLTAYILPWKRGRWLMVGVGLLALLWPRWGPVPGRVHIACLDVGQAQAVVLRDLHDRWMIIDAGGVATPRFNVGEGLVSSYLWHYGVRRLERIVISHPQKDHMSGVASLLRNFPVGELWLGMFPELEQTNLEYRELIRLATDLGVKIYRVDYERQQVNDIIFFAKYPNYDDGKIKYNDHSLVVMVALGQKHFLFPGDLEAKGEKWFGHNNPFGRYSVVLAPHHGSKSSSTRGFIAATQPEHVVFSGDGHARNKLPHPEVVARWQQAGANVWRTDWHGTVVWETDGRDLWFQPPDRGG
ncbi:MAG: DNA internalization-related competence protein ComEC/Rec2 [Magnetococcales bacterium]|nr:DNA internalization-related competence protein ComEC/Rec2 [Magnetococcales bacterium]